jgi:quercetin dioxygenase-like cupin family protein
MIEKAYRFTHTDDFIMEKIIDEEHVNINHIVVAPGGSVPVHVANSHVHQIIVRGTISLKLEDEPVVRYTAGSIVAIPFNTKMDIRNEGSDTLEFFVVKAPNPRSMPATKKSN